MGLVVVGGGASGMFAAIAAARAGVRPVTVLEQGAAPLRKLLARCVRRPSALRCMLANLAL